MTAPVVVTREGALAVIRLASPATRNAIDLALAGSLGDAMEGAADAGAIALLADGDQFCVGGDVRAMAAADDPAGFIRALADEFHRTLRAMPTAPPIVVGVRGWAAGAGMSLVLSGDVVVAGRSASFRPAYPGIGVTPDGGMTWTLPRVVGERRARSLLLQNRAIAVDEAQSLGIVDLVVADDEVESAVLELAGRFAAGPRQALAGAKRLVMDGADRSFADQLDAEAASIAACAGSADGREGVAAFAARRAPVFGR